MNKVYANSIRPEVVAKYGYLALSNDVLQGHSPEALVAKRARLLVLLRARATPSEMAQIVGLSRRAVDQSLMRIASAAAMTLLVDRKASTLQIARDIQKILELEEQPDGDKQR